MTDFCVSVDTGADWRYKPAPREIPDALLQLLRCCRLQTLHLHTDHSYDNTCDGTHVLIAHVVLGEEDCPSSTQLQVSGIQFSVMDLHAARAFQ